MLHLAAIGADEPEAAGNEPGPAGTEDDLPAPRNLAAAAFLAWLRSRDYRLPDEVDAEVGGAHPNLVYRLQDGTAAVFVTGDSGLAPGDEGRGERAQDDLRPFHDQRFAVGVVAGAVCSHDPIRRAAAKLAQAAVATSVSSPAGPGQVRASSRTWASTW